MDSLHYPALIYVSLKHISYPLTYTFDGNGNRQPIQPISDNATRKYICNRECRPVLLRSCVRDAWGLSLGWVGTFVLDGVGNSRWNQQWGNAKKNIPNATEMGSIIALDQIQPQSRITIPGCMVYVYVCIGKYSERTHGMIRITDQCGIFAIHSTNSFGGAQM